MLKLLDDCSWTAYVQHKLTRHIVNPKGMVIYGTEIFSDQEKSRILNNYCHVIIMSGSQGELYIPKNSLSGICGTWEDFELFLVPNNSVPMQD